MDDSLSNNHSGLSSKQVADLQEVPRGEWKQIRDGYANWQKHLRVLGDHTHLGIAAFSAVVLFCFRPSTLVEPLLRVGDVLLIGDKPDG